MKWVKTALTMNVSDQTGIVRNIKLSDIGEIIHRGKVIRIYDRLMPNSPPLGTFMFRTEADAAEAAAEIRQAWAEWKEKG